MGRIGLNLNEFGEKPRVVSINRGHDTLIHIGIPVSLDPSSSFYEERGKPTAPFSERFVPDKDVTEVISAAGTQAAFCLHNSRVECGQTRFDLPFGGIQGLMFRNALS